MEKEKIKEITEYIFLESDIKQADLALVFGTRHSEAINKVYELYKDKFIGKVLISGGVNRVTGKNEALEMSKKLIAFGIRDEDIILENMSTNSLENVLFSKKIIDEKLGLNNIKSIIVIVKHYHSRRALMTLKKHFPKNIKIILATYEVYGFNKNNWFESEAGREKVLGEWDKILRYTEKGNIEEI